jgi:membrane peptidoglycan carboxypeptidase
MTDSTRNPGGRRRPGTHTHTTKSGNTIKLHRSLGERMRANKEVKARKRAAYLSSLPKNRFKRILYRLHPKRVFKYWFSREGAIMALKVTGIGIVACFLLLVGVFAYFRKDLPKINGISGNQMEGSITYYDRSGQTVLWQDYEGLKRVTVESEKISKNMKDAMIAIEDKNFYKHGAFDVMGIARAGYRDIFSHGGAREGGSTITQQLVKLNQGWTEDRTIGRKVKELILAVEVEREYSKDEILTGYLNVAPFGPWHNGVQTVAQDYFGTSAKDLTIEQAAFLAAIPQKPSKYSPYGPYFDKEDAVGRAHYVLDQMVDQRMITKEQATAAKAVDVVAQVRPLQPKYNNIKAPYFVLSAKEQLEQKYGSKTIQRGGWKVVTTLDLKLQETAERQVSKGITQVKRQKGDTAAFAAVDVKTGQMVALVGGPDFNNAEFGKVNFAHRPLPPGSSFKPYDYAAFIDKNDNVGAGSVLYDTQHALPGYPCTNKSVAKDAGGNCLKDYDRKYPGPLTLRYSLAGSRNVPAVKAMLSVGVKQTIQVAEDMGLKSGYNCYQPGDKTFTKEIDCYGSSAIGDGAYLYLDEHVNGYATLSRNGNYIDQTYILKVTDARGKVIDEWKQPKGKQVIKADSAYIVSDMLSDPDASYLRADRKFHRYKGWHFAIKTGTTNDAKDGWMMSYSAKYAAGVWVGHHTGNVEMNDPMENMTQPILRGWMEEVHGDVKPENWQQPAGIKKMDAYVVRSKVSSLGEKIPSPSQDLYPSWYTGPKKNTGGGSRVLDQVSNKVATSCTPERAKKTEGNSNANMFSVDKYVDSGGGDTTDQDDVHKCDDAKPAVSLYSQAVCTVTCTFTVTVTQGTHPLHSDQFPGTVNLKVGGQVVQSQGVTSSPSTISFTYSPTSAGTSTVEAEVVDSVLYSSSEGATVTFATAGSTPPVPVGTGRETGTTTPFERSGNGNRRGRDN